MTDPTTDYARSVVAGETITGPHVRAACARHLRDLEYGPARGLTWDVAAAARVIGYFRTVLKLGGGKHEGQPFDPHPSQAFILGSLFGWMGANGKRRFRIAFVEEGKGSGKSPLAAGIGHYMTGADGEPRAETYAAAVDKDQASILFRDAVSMAKQSPALSRRVTFSGGEGREYNIAYLASASFFRPVSSESSGKGKSGFRPHCGLLDEIHEHPTNAMVEFILANIKGREQPLIFMITNSGYDRTSVCWDYHDYGTRVAAGIVEDDTFFSYICALDENEDPFTDPPHPDLGYPASWLKANPTLGTTIQPAYLEDQVRQAKGMPSKESLVRRLNFCQWVGAENPWIDADLWFACEVEEPPKLESPLAALALDLASKRDLVAAARVEGDGDVLRAEVRAWTPADTLEERSRKDRVPYDAWVRDGWLSAVPGRAIDYAFVVKDMMDWLTNCNGLAFDQWRIEDFQRALDAAGLDNYIWDPEGVDGQGLRLVRHGQGWMGGAVDVDENGKPKPKKTLWMPQSITETEDAIMNGRLKVRRNPILTHASASAVLVRDAANNAKWEKRKSTGRIDPLVTLSMAIGCWRALSALSPSESGFEVW